MKKIPTLFLRDPATNFRTLTREVHPDCLWVIGGEGVATRKYDGSCAMVRDGVLFKRREIKNGKDAPVNFQLVEEDENTGKRVGWVPVGDGPEDKYFREAVGETLLDLGFGDGTYELVGPKVQGNPEGYDRHTLVPHGYTVFSSLPRNYDGIEEFLASYPHEGIVWHHEDGRMAKIKRKDFGFK